MNSLSAIEKACREGYFVYRGNRQRIMGATASFHGVDAAKGNVWIHMWRTGLWDEVPLSAITVTNELIVTNEEENEMPKEEIGSGKKSGKRGGAGHTSSPSESAARAAQNRKKKGDATSSLKDLGEIVGKGKDVAHEEKKAGKGKRQATVTVTRSTAKQGELPGVQVNKRKIVEIESLADLLEDKKADKKRADEAFQDATDNLIASMRRHDRTSYSRSTWGSVKLKEGKDRITFKREKK